MNRKIFAAALLVSCFCSSQMNAFEINRDRGFWIGLDAGKHHRFDRPLAEAIVNLFQDNGAIDVVDFGCGMGHYVKYFQDAGFNAEGSDGNPDTAELSKGFASVQDLTVPFDLEKKFDWVMSLEVGEHIPKPHETIFIENLIRHCKEGIVLSWAKKGQGGRGHFNCQNNDYIKELFASYGFKNDQEAEERLRESSTRYWFVDTIMVFRRKEAL